MKRIIRKIIAMILIGMTCVFAGCSNAEFDYGSVDNARKAVSEFYNRYFILVPDEHIVFNEDLSTESKFVFEICWDPAKMNTSVYDKVDNVQKFEETLYVKEQQGVYNVYNEFDEKIFTVYIPTVTNQGTENESSK